MGWFLAGVFVGSWVGMFAFALVSANGRAETRSESGRQERDMTEFEMQWPDDFETETS